MVRRAVAALAAALVLAAAPVAAGSDVGTPAPPIRPSHWVNNKVPVTWESLQGRVILLELWAST